MVTLLEFILVLVVGATQAIPVVPGASRYEISPVRRVMSDAQPTFNGTVNIETPEGMVGADCSSLSYWVGETRYPCWPLRVTVPSNGDLTVWLSGDQDGEVVLVVRAIGYPHTLYLPSVMTATDIPVQALGYP